MLMNTTYKKLYKYKNQNILFPKRIPKSYKHSFLKIFLNRISDKERIIDFALFPKIDEKIFKILIYKGIIETDLPHLVIESTKDFFLQAFILRTGDISPKISKSIYTKAITLIIPEYISNLKKTSFNTAAISIYGQILEPIASWLDYLNKLFTYIDMEKARYYINIDYRHGEFVLYVHLEANLAELFTLELPKNFEFEFSKSKALDLKIVANEIEGKNIQIDLQKVFDLFHNSSIIDKIKINYYNNETAIFFINGGYYLKFIDFSKKIQDINDFIQQNFSTAENILSFNKTIENIYSLRFRTEINIENLEEINLKLSLLKDSLNNLNSKISLIKL